MLFLRDSQAQPIEIAPQDEINAGGEARIYAVGSDSALVAKIYRHPKKETALKLKVMVDNPPSDPTAAQGHSSIAWPIDRLRSTEDEGHVVGYLMPRAVNAHPVIDFYNPASRREICPLFSYQYLYRTARNLAAVMHALHTRNYVIGDVNESNILVTDTALITVVDTDSFQVRDPDGETVYHCPVGKPEFTPPELRGKLFHYIERTPAHDRFGLAVLIFELLMEGTHPFAGMYALDDDPPPYEARIAAGHFPHGTREAPYRPLPGAPPFHILPPGIRQLFRRCFEDGHENPAVRPDAQTWVTALREAERQLIACSVNDQHWYGKHLDACPWCQRTALLGGRDPFPSKERVQSGLHLLPVEVPVQAPLPAATVPIFAAPELVTTGGNQAVRPPPQGAAATAPAEPRIPVGVEHRSRPPVPDVPAAPSITFVNRTVSTAVTPPRHRWVAPLAILLILFIAAAIIWPLVVQRSHRPELSSGPKPSGPAAPASHDVPSLDVLFSAAQKAVSKGDDAQIRDLLAQAPQLAQRQGKDGWTLLHFAAYNNKPDAALVLLSAGADVNAREKDSFTPLHLAAQEGHAEVAKTLIEAGADVNAQESVGWTPLHFAAQEGRLDVAKLLLAHSADPNVKENHGLTTLAVASREHKPRLADLIRQNGGKP